MGVGKRDEENPASDEESEQVAEREKLNPPANDVEQGMELTKIPVKTRDGVYPEMIAGQSDPLIKAHHLKYMVLGFNLFLTILGLVLLSLSVWVRVDPEFWEYETTLKVDNFHAVCVMFIIASLVILIVGFVGCFGAATERRWLLIAYIGIFGIIFLLQLAAVVMMWSAPYSKTITKELEKQIQHQIEVKDSDDSSRHFIDFIQSNLQCCGAVNSKDYKGDLPNSCNSQDTGSAFESGCAVKMLSYLRNKAGLIGGFALPILLLQLLALLSAACLIKSLDVESKYFM